MQTSGKLRKQCQRFSTAVSVSMTGELVGNTDSIPSTPRLAESETLEQSPGICVIISPSGDPDLHENLGTIDGDSGKH